MNAIILTAFFGVVLMFTGAFVKDRTIPKYLALAGIIAVCVATGIELSSGNTWFSFNTGDMIRTNAFNLTFLMVAFGATALIFLLNGKDIERIGIHSAEYFSLIFFILCGVSIAATYNTLLMLFLGIEILSIPLYILTGTDKRNLLGNEAALKYFLMGSFSTGLLLMGIALLYGATSNATFYITQFEFGSGELPVLAMMGLVFLMVAMSFKVSAAPFHFWAPDVYDGAPTVITSFMVTVIKIAGFFAFMRLFENAFNNWHESWQTLVAVILVATLVIGNITAIFQQSVKRMLAYSSIAQAGFMMYALFAMNDRAREGLILYSAAYSLASIGLFAILVRMKDVTIEGFNGLGKSHPWLGLCATICLLSLTGIPLTAGFQAKLFMLMAAVENGAAFWIVITGVLFAAVSAYYYFRVIQAIYFKPAVGDAEIENTGAFRFLLGVVMIGIIALGINPEWLIGWLYR